MYHLDAPVPRWQWGHSAWEKYSSLVGGTLHNKSHTTHKETVSTPYHTTASTLLMKMHSLILRTWGKSRLRTSHIFTSPFLQGQAAVSKIEGTKLNVWCPICTECLQLVCYAWSTQPHHVLLSMHTWRYVIMSDWEKFPYNILFFWFSTSCQSGPIFPQFRLGSGLNNLLWGVLNYIRTPIEKIHCNMHTSNDSCPRHALHMLKQASLSP